MESIMCVPVRHLFLISEHERPSHQKKQNNNHFYSDKRSMILTLSVSLSSVQPFNYGRPFHSALFGNVWLTWGVCYIRPDCFVRFTLCCGE